MKYLSICMPTNGVIEWVFPVLDKVYEQEIDTDLYEVIVTDNGNSQDFFEQMSIYADKHSNLIYRKTNAFLFENQIEALRLGTGEYLKFLNHRSVLEPGALQWMIDLIKETINEKPVIFLSNGALQTGKRYEYDSFDGFVCGLKEYASWTTGVGVWRSDFEKIPNDKVYNKISPHSDVLFAERHRGKYIIDDHCWSHEIDTDHSKKGKYDLYKAFGVEELTVTLNLYIDGDITSNTFKKVKKAYRKCLSGMYRQFNVLKKPCSYVLDNFNDAMGIFFNKWTVLVCAYLGIPKMIAIRLFHTMKELFNREGFGSN